MSQHRKTAIVTGASGGIGSAIAEALVEHDYNVVLTGTSEDKLKSAEAAISSPTSVLTVVADVASAADRERLVDATLSRFGRIDVLVNNAGIIRPALLEDIAEDQWDEMMAVHLKGAFLCTQAVLPAMKGHGGGKIINVASRAAFRGEAPDEMPYGASKGALVTLTKTIARGFAADGVLAFAIAPGFTDTEMVTGTMDPAAIAEATSDIPLGEMAHPEEIGALAAFLCDDRVRHMTGATFDVNGASYPR